MSILADEQLRVIPNQCQLNLIEDIEVVEASSEAENFPFNYYNLVGLHAIPSFMGKKSQVIDTPTCFYSIILFFFISLHYYGRIKIISNYN